MFMSISWTAIGPKYYLSAKLTLALNIHIYFWFWHKFSNSNHMIHKILKILGVPILNKLFVLNPWISIGKSAAVGNLYIVTEITFVVENLVIHYHSPQWADTTISNYSWWPSYSEPLSNSVMWLAEIAFTVAWVVFVTICYLLSGWVFHTLVAFHTFVLNWGLDFICWYLILFVGSWQLDTWLWWGFLLICLFNRVVVFDLLCLIAPIRVCHISPVISAFSSYTLGKGGICKAGNKVGPV